MNKHERKVIAQAAQNLIDTGNLLASLVQGTTVAAKVQTDAPAKPLTPYQEKRAAIKAANKALAAQLRAQGIEPTGAAWAAAKEFAALSA